MAKGGRGGKRPNYGSKRRVRADGYVDLYLPDHPLARKDGYVFEHRAVAFALGLLKDPVQDVHHSEGGKTDNSPENLRVFDTRSEHNAHHGRDGEITRNQYGEFICGTGIGRSYRERRAALGERACEVCGADIGMLRIDAVVCGSRCRLQRWRRQRACL